MRFRTGRLSFGLVSTLYSEPYSLIPAFVSQVGFSTLAARRPARLVATALLLLAPALLFAVEDLPIAESPVFSEPGGVYTNQVIVYLTAPFPGGVVRFTLDGKEPTTASPVATGPITLTNSAVIRARSFALGALPSPVDARVFTILGPDLVNFNSNLPLIIIYASTRSIPDSTRTPAYLTFLNTNHGRAFLRQTPEQMVRAGIEVRGSSSTQFPKKSFGFELQDEAARDLHLPLLGFPSEADWILYAPYTDKTLMRDVLAYDLGESMGHYAVRRQFVEVFLDNFGSKLAYSDYLGVYVFLEKIKQDKNRVDIEPLATNQNNEPEVAGGYLIKKDRLDANDSQFTTARGQALGIEEPKQTTIQQRNWIKKYLDQFEAALYGTNYKDSVLGYARYIDVPSFIDHHWMVELSKNIDGFRLSEYMFKPRDGKLFAGPLWDYNLSFGNADYLNGYRTNDWYWPQLGDSDYPWRRRLFQDPDFNQRYIDRWADLRQHQFTTDALLGRVDHWAAHLSEAAARNYQRWRILGSYVWPNPVQSYTNRTYQGEVNWMKKWIQGRLNWIDGRFLPAPKILPESSLAPERLLSLSAPTGAVYYTLDGTDPRLSGGRVSSNAFVYTAPVSLQEGRRMIARTLQGAAWSAPATYAFLRSLPTFTIREIMFHPPADHAPFPTDDYEYVELYNFGETVQSLAGLRLTGGVEFSFGDSPELVGPKEFVLVVKNRAAFVDRYGDAARIIGEFTGNLSNSGEPLQLLGPADFVLADLTYHDFWAAAADGLGSSLVARCAGPGCDPDDRLNWRASTEFGGSPGRPDPGYLFRELLPDEDPAIGILQAEPDPWMPGRLSLTFSAAAHLSYQLEVRARVDDDQWQILVEIPAAPGDRFIQVLDDFSPNRGSRFYRLVQAASAGQ